MAGVSWQGKIERAWVGWHWETIRPQVLAKKKKKKQFPNQDNSGGLQPIHTNGKFFVEVCSGRMNWSAVHSFLVRTPI